jgi:hypothetical protein
MRGQSRPERSIPQDATEGKRPRRKPVGQGNVLTIPKEQLDPDYEYRFVRANNRGRVAMFEEAGYQKVTGTVNVGDKETSQMGSTVTVPSGDSAEELVLMRIKKEWYEEDQQKKQQEVDRTEEALKARDDAAGLTGEVKKTRR